MEGVVSPSGHRSGTIQQLYISFSHMHGSLNASVNGSGAYEINNSLSAAMGYHIYGLPTPLVLSKSIRYQIMPPFKYGLTPVFNFILL